MFNMAAVFVKIRDFGQVNTFAGTVSTSKHVLVPQLSGLSKLSILRKKFCFPQIY